MNLAEPMQSFVPTLEGPVLRALAVTTEPMSAREAHRRSGSGSEDGVRRALNRLVDQGLVSSARVGSSVQFQLNREHVAYPAVEIMVGIRQELLARIGAKAGRWSVQPSFVGMYGSFARGDGDESSDIDVLVVTTETEGVDDVSALARDIEAWTGNGASVMVLTADDLKRMTQNAERILEEWRRDLVPVIGTVTDLGLA